VAGRAQSDLQPFTVPLFARPLRGGGKDGDAQGIIGAKISPID